MRIAFFGGTFDPPHRGHTAIAGAALDRLPLDRILIAPVAVQPLKEATGQASFADRLAMVRLAAADDPRLVPSEADGPRPDGRPNYTFDALAALRLSLAPGDALLSLIGADAFLTIKQWHRAAELLFCCDFIVASRPGFRFAQIIEALPAGVELRGRESRPEWTRLQLARSSGGGSSLYLLPDLEEDISATEIRAALAGGSSMETILNPGVAKYIRAHGLYRRKAP